MKSLKIVLSIIGLLVIPISANADSALTHTSGNVEVAVTDFGSLAAGQDGGLAPNFKFPRFGNTYYLHEWSEIWIGNANGAVASALDLDLANPFPPIFGEWTTTPTGAVNKTVETDGRQIITAQYDSSRTPGFPLNILVDQQSFSWSTSNHPSSDDFIVMKLTVTNNSDANLQGIYVAVMANWDVDGTDPVAGQISQDWVDWDAERQTLFTYDGDDTDGTEPVHTGVTLLDGKLRAHQILIFRGPNGQLRVDTLLDASRSALMSTPAITATSRADLVIPGDYASVLSAGPYDIAARNLITVTFALVAGENLVDFQTNIDEARRISFAPSDLVAEVVSGSVMLKWEAPINPSVDGYTVLRRTAGEPEFQQISEAPVRGLSFTDTEIENGVEFTYKVRPVDGSGQTLEFDSLEVRVTPDVIPDAPKGLIATRNGDQIILNWTKSTQQINGYTIYRNHTGHEPWTPIASVSPATSTFADVNVYPNLRYFYTIAATNRSGGPGEFSEVADAAIPGETEVPPELGLNNVIVVPNPYRLGANTNPIEFRNLTRRATIRIYSSTGDLIQTIDHHNETPIEQWNGQNAGGELIAPGVYVYHVEALREVGRGTISGGGMFAVFR
ncbi:MAG: hypothetical protein O7E52_03985 [Candidatus Poribacteria bacterium]|nr:hypothetical protein [Candidatus Poribacteria bacterium]